MFAGIALIGIGIAFIVFENVFYNTIDDAGILQESLFRPIGSVALVLGAVLTIIASIAKVINRKKQ